MEREKSRDSHNKRNVRRISHGGKDETVDMSINPDILLGPVDPTRTLKDIKLLGGLRQKLRKVSRK